MENIDISIIVPVYNVEEYLSQCLDSLRFDNAVFEIICVNDGSTDGSLSILLEQSKLREELIIIDQENKGLSGARNTGLAHARGHYVWFVDSDDWIEKSTANSMLQDVVSRGAEITHFKYSYDDGTEPDLWNLNQSLVTSGMNWIKQHTIVNPVWTYIFSRELLESSKLQFEEKIYHEDSLFTCLALLEAKSILFLNTKVYNYRQRSESIMSSGKVTKHIDDLKHVINIKLGLYDVTKLIKSKIIRQDLNALIYYYSLGRITLEWKELFWFFSITWKSKSLKLMIKYIALFWQRLL